MKQQIINYRFPKTTTILTSLLFIISTLAMAQKDKNRTYLGLDFSQSGNQKSLVAMLTARVEGERGRKKLQDIEVEFYQVADTDRIFLGEAITDIEGEAIFVIPQSTKLVLNLEGEFVYEAHFKGNDDFSDVSESLAVKPLEMEISFVEVDSIKNISVEAYQFDVEGNRIPVEEEVKFYVPRQFTRLKIGEVELQDGAGMIEFPTTLPGDFIGNLNIIARIEESKDFGTFEISGTKDWGKPRKPVVIEKKRGLGDTDAPLWMVYTLIVLMSAVWFHYLYLFYMLFLIKKEGKGNNLV